MLRDGRDATRDADTTSERFTVAVPVRATAALREDDVLRALMLREFWDAPLGIARDAAREDAVAPRGLTRDG